MTDKLEFGRFKTLNKVCLEDMPKRKVSPAARLTWLILWRNARPDGQVRLSLSRLEAETGLSRKTILKKLKELIEKELVKIAQKGDRRKTTIYRIRVYRTRQPIRSEDS